MPRAGCSSRPYERALRDFENEAWLTCYLADDVLCGDSDARQVS
jgi:hypothetical protein